MSRVNDILNDNEIIESYIAYLNDEKTRLESTSGGLFYAFAEAFILDGGVVYGVAFDEQFIPQHIRVTEMSDLKKIQGSKYPQSNLNDVFKRVKKDLSDGFNVLFSGTPCQVAGLKCYLGKNFNNLLTIDLICHGVPSPGIWRKYLNYYFDVNEIRRIVFKHKINGWKSWRVFIELKNEIYQKERGDDVYMASYLNGWNMRPSCNYCKFKGISNHYSDITIADAWGKAEQDKYMNDNKGLSSVLIYTSKGEDAFFEIKNKLVYKNFPSEDIISGNLAYMNSARHHFLRQKMMKKTNKKITYITVFSNNCIIGKIIRKMNDLGQRR